MVEQGSSPLTQGTHENRHHPSPASRLIPARAGNTRPGEQGANELVAHPRSRGEHLTSIVTRPRRRGSSPLARGTRPSTSTPQNPTGLIPARAGNTMERGHVHPEHGAHPRSRGEHAATLFSVGSRSGSSPLARGTPGVDAACLVIVGLIPARAGNTDYPLLQPVRHRAHPRSRGEHQSAAQMVATVRGSSPLARGTLAELMRWAPDEGLIPARAGNT